MAREWELSYEEIIEAMQRGERDLERAAQRKIVQFLALHVVETEWLNGFVFKAESWQQLKEELGIE